MTTPRVYCTFCGAPGATGAQLCAECGARLPEPALVAESNQAPDVPREGEAAAPVAVARSRKPLLFGGAAAAAVLVTAGLAWGVAGSTPEPSADPTATAQVAVPTASAAPSPEETAAATVTGRFYGSMHSDSGNTYDYTLRLTEHSDGTIDARMRQTERDSGATGMEILTGKRSGVDVTLNGQYWEYSPPGWETDRIQMEFDAELTRFQGTYRCASCAGTLSGRRG